MTFSFTTTAAPANSSGLSISVTSGAAAQISPAESSC